MLQASNVGRFAGAMIKTNGNVGLLRRWRLPLRGAWRLIRDSGLSLARPTFFLCFLLAGGVSGYHLIEGWTLFDSLYMTVISVSTVGFGEIHPLSNHGRMFTMSLILGGVLFYGLALDGVLKAFVGARFRTFFEEVRMQESISRLKNHFIICGGGRMAEAMARELDRSGVPFVVLDPNPDSAVQLLRSAGKVEWLVLLLDALQEESLLAARIEQCRGLAAVLPTDADNLFVVLSARRLNPSIRIETRIARESTRPKMLQAGADRVLSPYSTAGLHMARSLLHPEVDEFLEVILKRAHYEFEMKIHTLRAGDPLLGATLANTDFRERGYLAVGIRTVGGRMIFAPHGDTVLGENMEILLLGPGQENEL
ncbi:MAG: NAD-binding protein [Leptospirales bacterium]|nr:NAD-binding protein [Leptospirales bacterium]